MESFIQNYDEFLADIRKNATAYITDDVQYWSSFIDKRIGEIGVESQIGTNFEVKTLAGFEAKNGLPYCTRFVVTGTCKDEDDENISYITKVLVV